MQLFIKLGCGRGCVALEFNENSSTESVLAAVSRCCSLQPAACKLTHRGRVLADGVKLSDMGVRDLSTLELCPRLLGGGGDGGSTGAESRSSYLEMYKTKRADKVDPREEKLARWTNCAMTGEPLRQPIVVDVLGNLFNKEALLNALIKKSLPERFSYIRGLKDVVELKPHKTANGDGKQQQNRSGALQFDCPVTGLECNGKFRFVVHRASGTVVSEKAVKDFKTVVEELVGGECKLQDFVTVNPDESEIDDLKIELAMKLAATRAKKRSKKDKLHGRDGAEAPAAVEPVAKMAKTAVQDAPQNGNTDVWNSIFLKEGAQAKETFLCRSVAARGLHLT